MYVGTITTNRFGCCSTRKRTDEDIGDKLEDEDEVDVGDNDDVPSDFVRF